MADHVLTASGDRTIKLWNGTVCAHTYSGHSDVVRCLAWVQGVGFLSSSNDGTVRLWELGGSCLNVFQASESFVYSVSVLPSGEWMTCSEDRTVMLNLTLIHTLALNLTCCPRGRVDRDRTMRLTPELQPGRRPSA